jgi:hypothetical protein
VQLNGAGGSHSGALALHAFAALLRRPHFIHAFVQRHDLRVTEH